MDKNGCASNLWCGGTGKSKMCYYPPMKGKTCSTYADCDWLGAHKGCKCE